MIYLISLLANKFLQPFWFFVYKLGLAGMGYGYGINHQDHVKIIGYKKLGYHKTNKRFIFFDVGANIGQTIDEIVQKNIKNLLIYSFEPQLAAYNKLKKKSGKEIKIYNIGFLDSIGTIDITTLSDKDVAASIHHKDGHIVQKIHIDTIDNFCLNNNVPYISYLKMDIEGSEYQALLGAKNMIDSGKIEAIEFEFLRKNIYSRHFLKDFRDLLSDKYIIYRVLPRDIYEIKEYSHLLEIYCLSNFLCLKK